MYTQFKLYFVFDRIIDTNFDFKREMRYFNAKRLKREETLFSVTKYGES